MNSNLTYIGANIRRFRKSRKWTQEEMAKRANISRIALIHIESSKALPTLDTLSALAGVLEIPITSLMAKPITSEPTGTDAQGESPDLTHAVEFELTHIVDSLKACTFSQIVAVRRIIDSVLLGFSEGKSIEIPQS